MSLTRLVCSVVTGLSVAFAVHEVRRILAGRRAALVGRGQAIRRVVGSVAVAVLMVLVYLGLEVLDPFARPNIFVMVWGAVMGLVFLLLLLGLLDWREVQANQELERTRELLRANRGDLDLDA